MVITNDTWLQCLQTIREKLNNDHVFEVWFSCISMESYDAESNRLLLAIPSRYVYEFIELWGVRVMNDALKDYFPPSLRVSYHVMEQHQAVDAFDVQTSPIVLKVGDAAERIRKGMQYYCGEDAKWIPAYDKVADWASDNKGRGLLCVGGCGLGKTVLCTQVLPVLMGKNQVKVVSAVEMANHLDEMLKYRCLVIDGLGTEPCKVFGRSPFFEICDAAERDGRLLIVTTNLSTTPFRNSPYQGSILERYGEPVLERLKAITNFVEFKGNSMR